MRVWRAGAVVVVAAAGDGGPRGALGVRLAGAVCGERRARDALGVGDGVPLGGGEGVPWGVEERRGDDGGVGGGKDESANARVLLCGGEEGLGALDGGEDEVALVVCDVVAYGLVQYLSRVQASGRERRCLHLRCG